MKMDCRCGFVFCLLLFAAEGNLVAQKPGLCPDGSNPVQCFVNPCDVSSCRAYPFAECRANYCGGCNAEYYVEEKRVDCSVCRDGSPPEECENQCLYSRPAPGYTCVQNYCCGCSVKFMKLCKDYSKPKECLIHPCATILCPPGQNCQANFCDCTAECVADTPTKG